MESKKNCCRRGDLRDRGPHARAGPGQRHSADRRDRHLHAAGSARPDAAAGANPLRIEVTLPTSAAMSPSSAD